MLAGKGEAFRLMNALNDRHGVLADLRQDLRVPRLELVGREVGLIVPARPPRLEPAAGRPRSVRPSYRFVPLRAHSRPVLASQIAREEMGRPSDGHRSEVSEVERRD